MSRSSELDAYIGTERNGYPDRDSMKAILTMLSLDGMSDIMDGMSLGGTG